MTTKEEFYDALRLVSSCSGTISCGCQYDEDDASFLASVCRRYISIFEESKLC